MLEQEDIQKIVDAIQRVFVIREDLEDFKDEMTKNFSGLQTSIDTYAKKADGYFREMLMMSRKIDRHEKRLHQVAEKLNLKLEY